MKDKGKCFSACNQGQRRKGDGYQTPYSITEQLLVHEKFNDYGTVLEAANGTGAMIKVLEKWFEAVHECNEKTDFFLYPFKVANIITNPPYSKAKQFILHAKHIFTNKIAFLLPLSYLHGQERYKLKIFDELKCVHIFTRYPMLTDMVREDGKYNTGMIAYAWYVWEKGYTREPVIKWIDNNKYVLRKGKNRA